MLAAGMIAALMSTANRAMPQFYAPMPIIPKREPLRRHSRAIWIPRGIRYEPNGLRETARRLRQIAAGSLTISNGLEREPK